MAQEHARDEREPALALLGCKSERRTVYLDRVLVACLDADQLGELALLHDHELARLLDDGEHFGHARRFARICLAAATRNALRSPPARSLRRTGRPA
jgi:hypothetical protein